MVRFDVAKDEKLTVGDNEFHIFMIRSTKNICRTLQKHCVAYIVYIHVHVLLRLCAKCEKITKTDWHKTKYNFIIYSKISDQDADY